MIVYDPFWNTLKIKGVSTYALIQNHGISSGTLTQMRNGEGISTLKIDDFCRILNCEVQDIIRYIPDSENDD